MRSFRWLLGGLFTVTALLPGVAESQSTVLIEMETDLGTIMAEIDTVRAPVTAMNFLRYVDMGMYSGGTFYRTLRPDNQPDSDVKIGVIQGGIARDRRDDQLPPIRMEPTGETGLLHLDGVLSMARAGPNTGQGEFFICVGPQPELDEGGRRNPDGFGFAAFGRVVGGMDVVRSIQSKDADGQYFREGNRVRILGIRRVG
jgi:peptidyl-prolyl cis-trans isomerase A (cyclophilin A)